MAIQVKLKSFLNQSLYFLISKLVSVIIMSYLSLCFSTRPCVHDHVVMGRQRIRPFDVTGDAVLADFDLTLCHPNAASRLF